MCSWNFEIMRYGFLHKTRVSFGYWVHRTRLRNVMTRLTVIRRTTVMSFRFPGLGTALIPSGRCRSSHAPFDMVRTTLIMGLSQWKRAVTSAMLSAYKSCASS